MLDTEVRVTTGAADAILKERRTVDAQRIAEAAEWLAHQADTVRIAATARWSVEDYGSATGDIAYSVKTLAEAVEAFAKVVRAAAEGVPQP